jgi:hypothetical protein
MNILCDALQLVDIPKLIEGCTDQWYNQTLCKVNESVVRLGIVKGEYHWHKHDEEDEFFFTLNMRYHGPTPPPAPRPPPLSLPFGFVNY